MATPNTSEQSATFVDRRSGGGGTAPPAGRERRQFANHYEELSPAARELGRAIDEYKLNNRRRFITYEEMLSLILALGYEKKTSPDA